MSLYLSASIDEAIRIEGEKGYPYEICGFMLGAAQAQDQDQNGGGWLITKILPIDNARETEAKHNRFEIAPTDFMRAEREAIAAKLDLLGIYHSHPDHPAYPSQFDLEQALPFYAYAIVSVIKGKADTINAFKLSEDRLRFDFQGVKIWR
ncbi:MAG: M67 family metallopeptidase [Helicobacteraceae bacterium]|jgi:proteasome lid subunit RPN8/RPN11|nr:M67 family metallopeptidase [Helicobacteraceae bacterium]